MIKATLTYSGAMYIDHKTKILAYNFILGKTFNYDEMFAYPYQVEVSINRKTYFMLQEIESLDYLAILPLIEATYKCSASHKNTDIIQSYEVTEKSEKNVNKFIANLRDLIKESSNLYQLSESIEAKFAGEDSNRDSE